MDQDSIEIISVVECNETPNFEQLVGQKRLARVDIKYYQMTITCHLIKGKKENGNAYYFLCIPYFTYFNKKDKKPMKVNHVKWIDKNVNDQFQLIALQKLSLKNPNYFK